jgi:GAF domain-containing protein
VLELLSKRAGAFGEREVNLADLYAAQAAAALDNARLNQDAQRRAEEFSQLYDAGIDLIAILDVGELVDRAADWARRALGAVRAAVFVWGTEGAGPRVGESVSTSAYALVEEAHRCCERELAEAVTTNRQGLVVPGGLAEPTDWSECLRELGLRSQIAAPLRVGQDVLGAAVVHGLQADLYTGRDVDMLEFLAAQVSAALQNAVQFGQTEQALSVVERQARYQANVSQAVASLNERGTQATPDVLRLLADASTG